MASNPGRQTWTIRRPLVFGLIAVFGFLALLGVWSTRANIAGAVIGNGMIELSTTRTAVQHPIGGVVAEIFKLNGDIVQAGEVIVRLDDRKVRSDLIVTEGALFETLANIARLEAALEGRHEMIVHPLLIEAAAENPEYQALLGRLELQLQDHFDAIDTEMRLLDEQIAQTEAQIQGVTAQLDAAQDEQVIVSAELVRANELSGVGLIRTAELSALEKEDAGIRGEIGRLEAQIAELHGRVTESGLKRLSVMTDAAALIGTELSRLRPERTRLLEARTEMLDELARLEIRAPVSGQIIDSKVFGVQSVVVAASPLMMIVPDGEPVLARIRVPSTDIDQVFLGQDASMKFNSFNGRQIPIIIGQVIQISADASMDPRTQRTFYDVAIAMTDEELGKLGDTELIPGMPVEAFLATESRTPLNYVMRPIMFYFDRAFRDT
jgi:HlyD family secretion protein